MKTSREIHTGKIRSRSSIRTTNFHFLLSKSRLDSAVQIFDTKLPFCYIHGSSAGENFMKSAERNLFVSGNNSAVECNLAKVEVAGSNPVSRSISFLKFNVS